VKIKIENQVAALSLRKRRDKDGDPSYAFGLNDHPSSPATASKKGNPKTYRPTFVTVIGVGELNIRFSSAEQRAFAFAA
jgi:hypothetical protein